MKISIATLALLALATGVAGAQEHLSLDEALQMARENNKRIVAAREQMNAAESQERSAKALYRPQLSIEASALYTSTDGTFDSGGGMLPVFGADGTPTGQTAYFPGIALDYEVGMIFSAGLKLEQPIYMGGKIKAGNDMAEIGREIANQNIRLTQAEVTVETCRAYATVVQCRQMVEVAHAYNALLQELMRTVSVAYGHGMKPKNDVLKVQVKLDESALNIRRAENGLRLATMNLCYYTGLAMDGTLTVDSVLPTPQAPDVVADISARPEWQMLEKKSQLAEKQVKSARADQLPQVGLMGQVGYTNGVELNGEKLIDGCSFMVGAQVKIPIDIGVNTHKVRQAKAERLQAEAERDDTNQRMLLEASQAANNLDEAILEVAMAQAQMASADENLRSSTRQYQAGKETLSDHLEAQVLWQQAQGGLIRAQVEAYLRHVEYQKAIGALD